MEYEIEVGNHWFRVIDKNNRKNQIMVRGFIEYSKKIIPHSGLMEFHVGMYKENALVLPSLP